MAALWGFAPGEEVFESCNLEHSLCQWVGVDDGQLIAVLFRTLGGVSESAEPTRVEKCELGEIDDDVAVHLTHRVSERWCRD